MKNFPVTLVLCGILATILNVTAQFNPSVPCVTDANCKSVLGTRAQMKCVTGSCMCVENNKWDYCTFNPAQPRSAAPVPAVPMIGRACSNDTDCNLENGSCDRVSHQCLCAPGFANTTDNKCVKAVDELSKPCQQSEQCSHSIADSTCGTDGKCRCADSFHEVNKTTCAKTARLNEHCNPGQGTCLQLVGGKNSLICSETVHECKCDKSYKEVNGQCVGDGSGGDAVGKISYTLTLMAVFWIFSMSYCHY